MALIQYAAPWDRQPQEAGRLADAYSDAVIAWLPHDLTGNGGNLGRFTHQGALTHSVTPSGLAYHSSDYAANNRLTGRTLNPATLNWPGVTVVARLTAAALPTSSYPAVVSWLPEGEYYGGFNLSVETSDAGRTFIYWRAGNNTAAITPTGYYDLQPSSDEYALGDKLTIVAGWDGATTWIVLNRNGVIYSHSSAHTGGWRNLDSLVALLGYERAGFRTSPHPTNMVAVLPRDLRGKALDLALNPWQLFAPQTIWVPVSAGGGGASGTSATTNANDTPSASGTTTVTGTSSKTNANDTSSASGTTTVVGTSAKTNANDASSASGTTTVIGTLAKTNADDTSAASGTVGSSGTTGTVAATNANDTAAASGTTKIVGTLSTTNANDAATASGVAGAVSGTVAVTNANDTASAVGDAGAPVASGAGMGFSMSRMRRLVKIQFNGKLYQAFEEDIPELLETLEEQAEQKIKKKRNARAKPAPVATVVSAPADVLPSLQSRIDDVNHSIGVLWGVDEDEDEELLWLML